ncbi:hypothetical protein LOTGIDRAFT_189226 [Lottia gigantea]|uniref:LMBR1 domain-containing protein 2 n=1 Tax=Lottia gigantea TaxID=225164 RepID=V4AH51_LOTGI|nr:hypothetical protein LOTGIDRAFT_189226 [Lottia gigantea]ESO94505.1 hypothetical protein LOTGIDRAFT_189226 [Lottia gigantea]
MSAGPLVVEIICTCLLAAIVLHRYGDLRKQHVLVTLTTFIAWYFSFMIIFILPMDVSSTFYRQCLQDNLPIPPTTEQTANITTTSLYQSNNDTPDITIYKPHLLCQQPLSYVPDYVLPALWRVVYWTSQVLTWLVLPMMQSYSSAGDFTVSGKIKSALIENAIFYGTYLLIFGICLIYVAARPDLDVDGEKLKVIGVTASNTWGLFVLVLMLGYGLVEVPRAFWNSSKRGYTLSSTHFKIAKLSTEKTEAEEGLEDVLEETKRLAEKIRYNHPLRKNMDTILAKCPESLRNTIQNKNDDFEDYETTSQEVISPKNMVKLHKRLIRCVQLECRTKIQWNMLMERAFDVEDTMNNETNPECVYRSSYPRDINHYIRLVYTPKIEWYWKCKIRAWFMMVLSVILMVLSFMVVWSECLFFIKDPILSIFAVFIDSAQRNYDYVYIEFASILTISYICFCAYYSVFQIKIFNYYYIAPHHQTNEYSIIFTGILHSMIHRVWLLSLTALSLRSVKITKIHTLIMGHMDVISIISDGFNIYFPILIVLLCICTYFSLGSRCLSFLGFQQFIGDDEMTQELMDEGRELVKRERRRLDRKADSDARRKTWNEKFTHRDSSSRFKDIPSGTTESRRMYTVPRSPDDNDRTELLRQAEPIDYTDNDTIQDTSYQQSNATTRYNRSQPPRSTPPRGIFDDV